MKNRCSEFSIPIIATATATVVRNGSINRVSSVVSSSFPGTPANSFPDAMAWVIGPANTTPRTTRTPVATSRALMTRLPSRQALSRPCVVRVAVNVGTNAAVIAPSANRSRRRFGTLNATLNASISGPLAAPKIAANTVSRATPRTRLAIVAILIRPADRAIRELIWSRKKAVGTSGTRQARVLIRRSAYHTGSAPIFSGTIPPVRIRERRTTGCANAGRR